MGRLRNDYQVWTPSIFPLTERWLSLWQQSGLGVGAAIRASSSTATSVIGSVEQEMILGQTEPADMSMLSSFPDARLSFAMEHAALLDGPGRSQPAAPTGRPSSGRSSAAASRLKPRSRRA